MLLILGSFTILVCLLTCVTNKFKKYRVIFVSVAGPSLLHFFLCFTYTIQYNSLHIVQFSCSVLSDSAIPWTAARQASQCIHQLQEFNQTHVHWVSNATQPSHPLCGLLLLPSIFPNIRVFPKESVLCTRWPKYWNFSFNINVPMNTQDWSPLGWTGWISLQSYGLSQDSPTPQFESINSLAFSFLYSSTLTSTHNYWKNHSID